MHWNNISVIIVYISIIKIISFIHLFIHRYYRNWGRSIPSIKNSSFEQHVIVCITDKIFIIYLQTVIQIHFRCCNCCTRDTFQMCLKLICIDLEKSVILLTVKSCTQLQSYRRSFHSNNIPYYYYYIATSK